MIAGICDPIVAEAPEVAAARPLKALFLDRDGVINVNHGYVHSPRQTQWLPGIFELARSATLAGYVLVVVTNQAGIARGYYTQAQFEEYTRWVHSRFAREGAPILATYYCPHHPQAGLGDLRVACACRKPAPGMLLRAIADYGIDPAASVLIGDSDSDIEAGKAAGIGRMVLLQGDQSLQGMAHSLLGLGENRSGAADPYA